jgi:hypothetical protein
LSKNYPKKVKKRKHGSTLGLRKKSQTSQLETVGNKDISLVSVIKDLEEWHRDLNNTKQSSKSKGKGKKEGRKSSKKVPRALKHGKSSRVSSVRGKATTLEQELAA